MVLIILKLASVVSSFMVWLKQVLTINDIERISQDVNGGVYVHSNGLDDLIDKFNKIKNNLGLWFYEKLFVSYRLNTMFQYSSS